MGVSRMTDKEIVEEYIDKKYLKDMGIRRPVEEALLYGLAKGRKEGYEQGYEDCNLEIACINRIYKVIVF